MIEYQDDRDRTRTTMDLDALIVVLTALRKKAKANQPVLVRFEDISGWRLTGVRLVRPGKDDEDDEDEVPCVLLDVGE